MKGLDIRKYIAVPFEEKEILPWIADESKVDQIKLNSAYLQNLKKVFRNRPDFSFLKTLLDHENDEIKGLELEECTQALGILSSPTRSGGFISLEDHNAMLSDSPLALLTERFYGRLYENMGSGRHALLKDVQLKGVGNNPLAICEDYYHRWGGFIARDALKSFLSDIVVNKRTQLGSLQSIAAFTYKSEFLGRIPLCMQMRDARSFRLAQVHPDFLTKHDVQMAKDHLAQFFKESDPHIIFQKILSHYVHSFSVGIHFRSPTFDNLLVDGRFIDCESIDFTLDKRPVPRFIKIAVPNSLMDGDISDLKTLGDALEKYEECFFIDSPAHYLYKLGKLTWLIFQNLWKDFNFDVIKTITQLSEKYLSSHLRPQDWSILNDYSSSTLVNLMGTPDDELTRIKAADFKSFSHFELNHTYNDPLINSTVICFAENMKEDLRFECNKVLMRWETVFWPHHDTCTWQNAFDNYQKMKDSIE